MVQPFSSQASLPFFQIILGFGLVPPACLISKIILLLGGGIILSGCSTPLETFDCREGKGVGCKSLSAVNQMVEQGVLGAPEEALAGSPLSPTPLPPARAGDPHPPRFSPDSPEAAFPLSEGVQRIREDHVRVWVAPYQDAAGNYHEGSVIHTVLRPGYWQVNGQAYGQIGEGN